MKGRSSHLQIKAFGQDVTNSIAIRAVPSSVGSSRSKSAITQGAAVGGGDAGKKELRGHECGCCGSRFEPRSNTTRFLSRDVPSDENSQYCTVHLIYRTTRDINNMDPVHWLYRTNNQLISGVLHAQVQIFLI